jgi:hypothetical protein
MDDRPHFIDDRHAQYAGWVLGCAMRAGVKASPVYDADGNYTDRITIRLTEGRLRGLDAVVTLIVPPPPDDWPMDDG